MSKVAFVADVHLGNHQRYGGAIELGMNRRCREVLETLKVAVAEADECESFGVLGDLFDVTKPIPQMVKAVQDILEPSPSPFVMMGNHDQVSSRSGDHALGPLEPVSEVIETPNLIHLDDCDLVVLPFRPGVADDWVPEDLDSLFSNRRIRPGSVLCLHLGIKDSETPSYLTGSHDCIDVDHVAELMQRYDIIATVAGNWHELKSWKRGKSQILQIGTLAPTGWDNPGLDDYGHMAIWDSKTMTFDVLEIPGPRFLKIRDREELKALPPGDEYEIYLEWTVSDPNDLVSANQEIEEMISKGRIVAGGAFLDKKEQEKKARVSAKAAASSETLEDALSAYINTMELDERVTTDRLIGLTKRYLG